MVVIEPPEPSEVDSVAALWVALAEGQRRFGSHLRAAANRDVIRNELSRTLLTGGLLVARQTAVGDADAGNEIDGDTDDDNGMDGDSDTDDGEMLGFVMFGPESGSYRQDVARGAIHNLYVRPEFRGEGIGSKLVDAAEEALADAGVEAVSISAMAANDDARRLYRKHGYEPHRVELETNIETTNHSTEKG